MKLTDLNRDGGIGANSLLVRLGDFNLLVDCGLHPKKTGTGAMPDFPRLRGVNIDLVVLTHCHLDHLGAIPVLLREHPVPPVVMSVPSHMLAERMLHNSVNVMERQRDEERIPGYPLFTHEEVARCTPRFFPLPFGQGRRFHGATDDIEITLHPAGHVAGAAGVEVRHKHRRLFFTGDVLFKPLHTLPGASFPRGPFDIVVTETTRGDTERGPGEDRASEVGRLITSINHTIDNGGSVLIPVFALGRMQEILTILHDARKGGRLRPAPVFTTGLGLDLVDYMDEISRKTGLVHFTRSVLKELGVRKPSKNIVPGQPPAEDGIYVLSSGMLVENTPSYIFASGIAGSPRHLIAYVGYCDPDTPGGRMLATSHGSRFLFEAANIQAPLKARVERFELSGHADRGELADFALACRPRTIVLTHGDPPARAWFEAEFAERAPKTRVLNPEPLREYAL